MNDPLLYKRPRVADFDAHRVLHDLQEDETLFQEFMADPEAVVSRYALDEEAHRLIVEHDFAGLRRRGIHAVMIVQFQRHIEWGVKMTAKQ